MYIFNMDLPNWYAPKETNNANFPSYYNHPYEYNKNLAPYVDPVNCHNIMHYNNVSLNNNSAIEIRPTINPKEFESDNDDCKLWETKTKPTQTKKMKAVKKERRENNKSKSSPLQELKPAPCRGQYKHSDCDKVSEKDRYLIYKEFHELNNSQSKWQFIASHVYVHAKSKCTSKGPSRRENTHHYYLTVGGQKVKVCRKFFLTNLNISEAVIRTSLEKLSPQGICQEDNRGRKPPPNKLSATDEEFLRSHILSFPPVDANCSKGKSSKKYLDSNLSISSMHKMYLNVCSDHDRKPVSVETYRRICKEYSISFLKTQKDQSKMIIPPQTNLPFKPNEPILDSNLSHTQRSSPPNNFSFTSYLLGVEAARGLNERANSFLSPMEKTLLPVEPQSSFCQDFLTESDQNNTVLEIGMMSKPSEKTVPSPPPYETKGPSRSTSKMQRLKGESYVDSKGILQPARPLRPSPCKGRYKHSECDSVSDESRVLIYREFRNLRSSQAQWQFIASHVSVYAKSKCTSKGPSRRENTRHYYLTVKGQKVKVCRKFFLATLNVSEAMIRTSLEKLSLQGICQDDNRGRKPPPNKLSAADEEFVRQHILSFRSVDSSFYGKKNKKKYLDAGLNLATMHKMFAGVCRERNRKCVSIETYRRICKECDIAFVKPPRDSPKKCLSPPEQWQSEELLPRDHPPLPYHSNEHLMIHRDPQVTFLPKQNPPENTSIDFDLQSLLYMSDGPSAAMT